MGNLRLLKEKIELIRNILIIMIMLSLNIKILGINIEKNHEKLWFLIILVGLVIYLYSFYLKKVRKEKCILIISPLLYLILEDSWTLTLPIVVIMTMILIISIEFMKKEKEVKEIELEELYEERIKDKEKMLVILNEKNKENQVVALDGYRGSGKTVLKNHILKELENKKEIITITITDLEKEKIKSYLYSELNKILRRNRVYINLLPTSKIGINLGILNISDISFSNKTEYEKMNESKNQIRNLDKEILIVIDDLDREESEEKIKYLFNIISNLLEGLINIKCLYILSRKELVEEHKGLNYDYIEKYIPIIEKITPIERFKVFNDTVRRIIKDENKKEKVIKQINEIFNLEAKFEKDEANFLNTNHSGLADINPLKSLVDDGKYIIDLGYIGFNYDFPKIYTTRKAELLVNEINNLFNSGIDVKEELIINISYFKVFFPEEYEKSSDEIMGLYSISKGEKENLEMTKKIKLFSKDCNIELSLEEYQDYLELLRILKNKSRSREKWLNLLEKKVLDKYNQKYKELGKFEFDYYNSNIIKSYSSTVEELERKLKTFRLNLKKEGNQGLELLFLELFGIPINNNFTNKRKKKEKTLMELDNISDIKKIIYKGEIQERNFRVFLKEIKPLLKEEDIKKRKNNIEEKYNSWRREEKGYYSLKDSIGDNVFINLLFSSNFYRLKGYRISLLECYLIDKNRLTYYELLDFYETIFNEYNNFEEITKELCLKILSSLNNLIIYSKNNKEEEKGILKEIIMILSSLVNIENSIKINFNYSYGSIEKLPISSIYKSLQKFKEELIEKYKDDESEEIQIYKQFLEFAEKELNKFI